MKDFPKNPDVIVVGAVTAGLSSARFLMDHGKSVAVLEARPRIGGRCITDNTFPGKAFDRGGSWLHSAEINPLARLAEERGFKLHKRDWVFQNVHLDGHLLNSAEVSEYEAYRETMWEPVFEGIADGSDASIESLLPNKPWRDSAKYWVPQLMGADTDVVSARDLANYHTSDGDWLVEGGLGNFVTKLHDDIPVKLNCSVSEIDHSGNTVRVVTPFGELTAGMVIVTVSTGVLAAERIRFKPGLPERKLTAVENLPNGLLNKIGLDFDPEWKEANQGHMAAYHPGGEEYCTLLFGFFNSSLAVGFVAGRFGKMLEKEGEGAATEFCLEGLKSIFGNDAAKHVRQTAETAWMSNEHTLGSYSAALPGYADARNVLAEPINASAVSAPRCTTARPFLK